MASNVLTRKVEWGDCDPAGIVHYPRYFAFMDTGTIELLESLGLAKAELLRVHGIIGMPLVSAEATFSRPCRYGHVVTITSSVAHVGRSSFRVHHLVERDDARVLEGTETRVWTARDPDDPDRVHAVPVPEDVAERLRHG